MPKLIVMSPDGESTSVELTDDSASIGRLPQNTIQIDDVACSRRHCQILRIKSGFELTDMKSRNGTKVNGVQRNRHVLSDGDIIEIGEVRITYRERDGAEEEVVLEDYGRESEIATEGDCYFVWANGESEGKKVPLSAERTTLGRKESNTIVLKDHMVSSYHCEVTKEAGGYVLRDLGSTNGCVLNGETVSESTLSHGARLRLGKTIFVFVDPAVADFEQAMGADEDVESDWGMMRAQVDMARVKRKRTWNLIVALVVVVFFGGIIGFVTWKPEAVQEMIGIEDTPPITRVPGNLLGDESFEQGAVAWTIADETAGSAMVAAGPTKQGQRSLEVVGPAEGWDMAIARSGDTSTVAVRQAYEVSAWIRPDGPDSMARFGVEWLTGDRSEGLSLTPFATGAGWQRVTAIVTPPKGAVACRAVAVVTGPGSARFDDVAVVVTQSSPRPFAELESGPYDVRLSEDGVLSVQMEGRFQLWDGGVTVVTKDGRVATASGTFIVNDMPEVDGGIKATGRILLPEGMGEISGVSLAVVPGETGAKLIWEATGAAPADIAEIGLSFAVSRTWLSGGASFASEDTSQALGGETDASDVQKVILGGPGSRLSLGAMGKDVPVRLRMTSRGGVLRMALLCPVGTQTRSFTAITDFGEEKKEAKRVLSAARAKRSAGELGEAIKLYNQVVNVYPYEDAVREMAEKEGKEIADRGRARLTAAEILYQRAKDFHHMADLRDALRLSEMLFREFQGHEFAGLAKTLAQEIATDIAGKDEAFLSTRVGRIMRQAEEYYKNKQSRLAALFYRMVVEEYPDTKVASEAQSRLDEIRDATKGQ